MTSVAVAHCVWDIGGNGPIEITIRTFIKQIDALYSISLAKPYYR